MINRAKAGIDGECATFITGEECVRLESTLKPGEDKCFWDGSNCHYNAPEMQFSAVIFIMLLAICLGLPLGNK